MQNYGEIAMISEIATQENYRSDKRRNHAVAMRNFISAFDEDKSQREKYRAQTVERGVNNGQIMNGHWSAGLRPGSKTGFTTNAPDRRPAFRCDAWMLISRFRVGGRSPVI